MLPPYPNFRLTKTAELVIQYRKYVIAHHLKSMYCVITEQYSCYLHAFILVRIIINIITIACSVPNTCIIMHVFGTELACSIKIKMTAMIKMFEFTLSAHAYLYNYTMFIYDSFDYTPCFRLYIKRYDSEVLVAVSDPVYNQLTEVDL